MDVEQLKLILDMVGDAGDGAFLFALLWLLKGLLVSFAWITLAGYLVYGAKSIFDSLSLSMQLREAAGYAGSALPYQNERMLDCMRIHIRDAE